MAAVLLCVMLFGAVMESFGLSLLLPLFAGLLGQDVTGSGVLVTAFGRLSALFDEDWRLEGLLGLLAVAFLVKGVTLTAGAGLQTYFAMRLRAQWTVLVFDYYLTARLDFLYRERHGRLVQNVANETQVAGPILLRR